MSRATRRYRKALLAEFLLTVEREEGQVGDLTRRQMCKAMGLKRTPYALDLIGEFVDVGILEPCHMVETNGLPTLMYCLNLTDKGREYLQTLADTLLPF